MLHITNGDCTKHGIEQSGVAGHILAWKDILHEGPTPAALSLAQMSTMRAHFLADFLGEPYAAILSDFTQRDATLAQFHMHDEVILWFEHDLYDQLQLLQLLDWFAQQERGTTRLSFICIAAFPGVSNFRGLGQLSPPQLASLYATRQEISEAMLSLGHEAWQAYCSTIPTAVEAIIRKDTSVLPFLKPALLRHLEQFPARENGLSRTERQILEVVASGISSPVDIFLAEQNKEESPFMGDTTFWTYLLHLCTGPHPSIKRADEGAFSLTALQGHAETFLAQSLVLTAAGHAILAARVDWISLCGGIDRWCGGVHLSGPNALWRWDKLHKALYKC